jgi:spore coat protein CotH
MKNSCTHLAALLVLAFSSIIISDEIQAQTLPDEMRFSDDNRRLVTGDQPVEGFYDDAVVNVIELWFSQPNYWSLLTNNYASGTNIPATMIVNGDTLASPVGVHFKGQTSYFQLPAGAQKRSFGISLNFVDENQDYDGYDELNLNNCFDDASFMREVVYYHQGRKHIPIAKANYSQLSINGENWGLYPSIQQLDGSFFKEWFLSNDGTRWRALKPGGGGPGGGGPGTGGPFGTGYSSLNWLGTSAVSEYEKYYTLKKTNKTNPWEDLIAVCDVLNNTPLNDLDAALQPIFDVDRALWFLATEIIFSDDDSYVHKGGMDYYLYWEPETGRLTPQEVDGNTCMKMNAVNWSPFYHETDDRFPLMNRLLKVPELRQRYLAHMRTIIQESLVQEDVDALIEEYFTLVDGLVQNDTKKLYTYNQFLTEKEVLKNYVAQRRNFLLANSEVNAEGPAVSDVVFSVENTPFAAPDAWQEVGVTAAVSSASGISKVILYYAPGFVGDFDKTEMYDDGVHGDGAAGDGIFGGTIPGFGNGSYVRFYIEAAAGNGPKTVTYMPAGAEHDVFVYQVNISSFVPSEVVVNEIMASNDQAVADQDGEFDDWIELFNNSQVAADISGWHLTDDINNLTKWTFPQGSIIGGQGYLIVWADENGSQAGLHANFKLSAAGEQLYLVDAGLNIAQELIFGAQVTDMGYARIPNGTGDFVIKNPTFNGHNEGVTAVGDEPGTGSKISIFPNPATGQVTLRTNFQQPEMLTVVNTLGQVFYQNEISGEMKMDVGNWEPGVYFLKFDREVKKLVVE